MMSQSTLIEEGLDEYEEPRPRRRKKSSRKKASRRKGTQKAAAEKNSMEAAIRRALKRMSSDYHPDCKTRTEVSEDIIAMAVLDPWAFPLTDTECVGCGLAPMKDAYLTKQTTVYPISPLKKGSDPLRASSCPLFFDALQRVRPLFQRAGRATDSIRTGSYAISSSITFPPNCESCLNRPA
jgi:hypothetical protein